LRLRDALNHSAYRRIVMALVGEAELRLLHSTVTSASGTRLKALPSARIANITSPER
jgi:hypothetical protein